VELPSKVPKDDYLLKDLEPLGWIKTQALELPHLSPNDITTQAKIMADHPEWGSSSICITAAFTPGSVSLSAHSLTVPGFEWGRKNQDTSNNPQVRISYRRYTNSLTLAQGFNPNMSERVQLLLSDRILGMTLVPEGGVWNYGIGLTQLWSPNIPYSITLDTPLLFWAEEHRPAAFLTVSSGSYLLLRIPLTCSCRSSQVLNRVRTRLMLKIASCDCRDFHDLTLFLALCIFYCIPNLLFDHLIRLAICQVLACCCDFVAQKDDDTAGNADTCEARGCCGRLPTKAPRVPSCRLLRRNDQLLHADLMVSSDQTNIDTLSDAMQEDQRSVAHEKNSCFSCRGCGAHLREEPPRPAALGTVYICSDLLF